MQTAPSLNPLHQDCLGKLNKVLDLAMKTAETASAEGNHKIVLQAVREVTRIVTLMTKLAKTPDQAGPAKTRTTPVTVKTTPLSTRPANPALLSPGQEYELYQKLFPDLFPPQPSENPKTAIPEAGKKRETTGTKPAVY